MTHEEITDALDAKGHSWGTAAAAIGRTKTMLLRVSMRDAVSRPVARALAVLIETPIEDVFPDKPGYHGESKEDARKNLIEESKARLKKAGIAA